jgi:protein-disulfide isomerase
MKRNLAISRKLGDARSASGRPLPGGEARPQPDQREGGVRKKWPCHVGAIAAAICAWTLFGAAQSRAAGPSNAVLKQRIVAFLNRSLGWQGLNTIRVDSISAPDRSGLRKATVYLAKGTQHQDATYLITADGREIIQGTASPLTGDPWAKTRAELDLRGAPAEGPANAPVTIVEFSDLECPFCKQEAATIAQLRSQDPGKTRVVFKYFPLFQIHPWAMDAAKAAVCVAAQHPGQFWNFERTVFADQDKIDAAPNAAQRLRGIALESEAQPAAYDACLNSPRTARIIAASIANGKKVGVTSTPTLFINGRLVPGAVPEPTLQALVDHEATYGQVALGAAPHGQQCGKCKPLPPLKPGRGGGH